MRLRRAPAAHRVALRVMALALALAAVSSCSTGPAPEAAAPAPVTGAAAAMSPTAELHAGLTALLVERVHVVAATAAALAGPEPVPAALALDARSVALADLLGATYSAAREPLLASLRKRDRLLVRHAVALPTRGTGRVRDELRSSQSDIAQVLRQVVPTLDADEMAERLSTDVRAQLAAGSPDRLRETTREARQTAALLTAAVAADRGLPRPTSPAVRLRADLTGLLAEHALLVAALGHAPTAARAALDGNAAELAELLGEHYPALRGALLRSWTPHLDRLERYAAARKAGQEAGAEAGLVQGYPAELARLLAEHVADLPAQTVRTELDPALVAQLDALDEAAAGSLSEPAALVDAVATVLPAAALVSAAIAEDLRLE